MLQADEPQQAAPRNSSFRAGETVSDLLASSPP